MMRRRIIGSLIALALALILYMVYNSSTLVVNVANAGSSISYQLIAGTSVTERSTNSHTFKIHLDRGSRELFVASGEKNFLTLVNGLGFLRSQTLNISLTDENARSFVGDNPDSCLVFDKTLQSYTCGGQFNTIREHVPATSSMPTYVTPNTSTPVLGSIRGAFASKSNFSYMVKVTGDGFGGSSHYALYSLDSRLNITSKTALTELSPDLSYRLTSDGADYLIYDSGFSQGFWLDPSTDKLNPVKVTAGSTSGPTLSDVAVNGQQIAALYSSSKSSEIVIPGGPNLKLRHVYKRAWLISNGRICLLDSAGNLDVFQLNNRRKVASFPNVLDAGLINGDFYITSKLGIAQMDNSLRSGHLVYSLGSYSYCGQSLQPGTIILCVKNSYGDKAALRLDLSSRGTDGIDKKLFTLRNSAPIKKISAYGKFVFVTPNAGPLVSTSGGYGYDPKTVSRVNAEIISAADKLGIDRAKYALYILD